MNQDILPIYPHLDPKLDIYSLNISSGENLPRWECHKAIYHLSFRLADSIPHSVLKRWLQERKDLITHAKYSEEEYLIEAERKAQFLYSEKIEKYLDGSYGKCYLRQTEIAELVANSLVHFNHVRYRLHAWCIMPNHVHVIAEAFSSYNLSNIIHTWKSYTAHRATKLLKLKGAFWQPDAYNHIIRSKKEYLFQIQYTWENPDKAGLHNWQWRWKTSHI